MAEFLGAIGIAARFSSLTVSETILRYETTAERAEQQPQTRLRPAHTTYGEFDVTDVGDPPKPRAIGYDYYGGKFSELECMFIGSFGDKFPRGVPVERRRVIDFQRSRGAPFLPKVGTDSKIVQELIRGDPRKTLSYVFLDDPGTQLSRNEVLKQIKKLLDECKKHGAMIWYAGHGVQRTGDWSFSDGIITFEDILYLYERYFYGRLLYIVTDCCYSGRWIEKLAEKMDEMGIGACGHETKERGYSLKIAASCRSDQIACDGLYTMKGLVVGDDGAMKFTVGKELDKYQTTMFLDTTSMRCFYGPLENCLLHYLKPNQQHWMWEDLVTPEEISRIHDRFKIVRGFDYGRRVWRIVFVNNNEEDRRRIMWAIEYESVEDIDHYALILVGGAGKNPPKDMLAEMKAYGP